MFLFLKLSFTPFNRNHLTMNAIIMFKSCYILLSVKKDFKRKTTKTINYVTK